MPAILGVVADRIRLEILMVLARSPSDVSALVRELDFPAYTVSYHLGVLNAHGLVQYEHVKTHCVYRLTARWTVVAANGTVHLQTSGSEGLEFELRIPEGQAIRWDPTPASRRPAMRRRARH